MFGSLRKRIFRVPLESTTFAARGFMSTNTEVIKHLEGIGQTFLFGYHLALESDRVPELEEALGRVSCDQRGFAYEGAAMALMLQDLLLPGKRDRLTGFVGGPGADHSYMVYVGAGWAFARLKRDISGPLPHWDPILGWLALDGYGFYEGYFNWPLSGSKQIVPRRLKGYACRVFDQGLGRSLWFVKGANVDAISEAIGEFTHERQADLWSGVGLACAYAGGVHELTVERLRLVAENFAPQLAQGAAFAAKARKRARNEAEHTEVACRILCGVSADEAAHVTDAALAQARYGLGARLEFNPPYLGAASDDPVSAPIDADDCDPNCRDAEMHRPYDDTSDSAGKEFKGRIDIPAFEIARLLIQRHFAVNVFAYNLSRPRGSDK